MSTRGKNRARVGIFMPAYNQGKYIHEALESLKAQTFQDFIVHIVDDASTDDVTIPTLKSLEYKKATVFLNEKNVGVNKLTAQHFRKLETEYLLILCADDTIEPTFLEESVQFLENNKEYGAVTTWLKMFGDDTGIIKYSHEKCTLPSMLVENNFCGSSLVRKEAMKAIDYGENKSEAFRLHQDWDRWVSLLEKGYKLGVIESVLFNYRILKRSLSHGSKKEAELNFRRAFYEKHKSIFAEHHEYVFTRLWDELLLQRENYKVYSAGHEWLDAEYKKQQKCIDSYEAKIRLLDEKYRDYEEIKKWSLYPFVNKIRTLIYTSKD